MHWIVSTLRGAPELALFLTLAAGFTLGQLKIKGFSLGTVTGVLLVGVAVGQLGIDISPTVKSTFFLLFLFAIGYGVGPQFVRGLKKEGLPQMAFAAVLCLIILGVTWATAKVAGFDAGSAAGVLSGAGTISAVIGVAGDTLRQLGHEDLVNKIPVAYAVTYIFGTAGTAWILASLGPKILGVDIEKASKEYELEHGGAVNRNDPTQESAYDGTTFRAFTAKAGCTVEQLEKYLLKKGGWPVYVERLRAGGKIISNPKPHDLVAVGDRVVLNGPIDVLLKDEDFVGSEVPDLELLDFQVGVCVAHVVNKEAVSRSIAALRRSRERHGVIIRTITRNGEKVPLLMNAHLQRGDVVALEGRKADVDRFAEYLGYAEKPTKATDLLYVALGIFLGGLLGSLSVHVGNVPFSLSASGGVLIMGIVFGWLRSTRPTFGTVPEASLWLMNNMGLTAFIAVVGIVAGPGFIAGLRENGLALLLAGVVVSSVPMFLGLLVGKYIFKFHPAINLGANAGGRTTTAALGAITQAAGSEVPALAYTVTYAVGSILLTIWGVVIVLLLEVV